jgi:hypothetical protein
MLKVQFVRYITDTKEEIDEGRFVVFVPCNTFGIFKFVNNDEFRAFYGQFLLVTHPLKQVISRYEWYHEVRFFDMTMRSEDLKVFLSPLGVRGTVGTSIRKQKSVAIMGLKASGKSTFTKHVKDSNLTHVSVCDSDDFGKFLMFIMSAHGQCITASYDDCDISKLPSIPTERFNTLVKVFYDNYEETEGLTSLFEYVVNDLLVNNRISQSSEHSFHDYYVSCVTNKNYGFRRFSIAFVSVMQTEKNIFFVHESQSAALIVDANIYNIKSPFDERRVIAHRSDLYLQRFLQEFYARGISDMTQISYFDLALFVRIPVKGSLL